jgi:hypothetical protein
MVIAMFMIHQQPHVATTTLLVDPLPARQLALGLALAFGLGGRPVAQQMLEDAYRKGREHGDRAKRDLQAGRDRAEGQAQHAGAHVGNGSGPSSSTSAADRWEGTRTQRF